LRHLDADLSGLSTSASSSDLAPLGVGGELRQVGERLVALQSPLAAHALDLLLNIAADAGSDAK